MATYRVLRGIDYPPSKRAERGDVVDDLPERSVKWLVEAGVVEQIDDPKPKGRKRIVDADEPVVFEEPVAVYGEEESD